MPAPPPVRFEFGILTPLGIMSAAVSAVGVAGLLFPRGKSADFAPGAVRWFSSIPLAPPSATQLMRVEELIHWLITYFSGEPPRLKIALDFSGLSPFSQAVLRHLAGVAWGQTITYGALAAAAGRPGGARAVGGVMRRNRHVLVVPCHRVLAAPDRAGTPRLGGFTGGLALKTRLLAIENQKGFIT